jgi:hypothetical protein
MLDNDVKLERVPEYEPDASRMHACINRAVLARTKLRAAKLELALYQAEMDIRKPRSPSARMLGVDDESERRMRSLHTAVMDAENEVDEYESELKFEEYIKETAKMRAYQSRAF